MMVRMSVKPAIPVIDDMVDIGVEAWNDDTLLYIVDEHGNRSNILWIENDKDGKLEILLNSTLNKVDSPYINLLNGHIRVTNPE